MAATAPIVLISVGELIILISILGSFTIDLAAMAGIIAAIGVGVDAQIVITDEILKKDDEHHTTSEKVDMAFGIIRTNAIVAICSMIPLLFSGLVEVIGFAISTILGALLGYLLTRPSYAAIVEKVLIAEGKTAK
jgi:preprotein translocase subunit SecD